MSRETAILLEILLATAMSFGINWSLWNIYTRITTQGERRQSK